MSGSHWVATYVRDKVINYFDSFGMPPFQEMVDHTKEKNLTLLHQSSQIQNLMSSTCGYFCLYFLNEMHRGNDYFDLLQVFDASDTAKNELFIQKYFKALDPFTLQFNHFFQFYLVMIFIMFNCFPLFGTA